MKKDLDRSLIKNISFGGVDTKDYPDFCDAYIESADYDGDPMTEEQLEEINEDSDFVYNELIKYLF